MTTPSRELTPEQIAPALAEAQGWIKTDVRDCSGTLVDRTWTDDEHHVKDFVNTYAPLTNNDQYNAITLDPEIHAGMIDVLDEWFGIMHKENNGKKYPVLIEYWHHPEYKANIRLWQLRACVEFLRNRRGMHRE